MSLCLGPPTRPFPTGHVKVAPDRPLAPYVDHYWMTRWDRRGLPPRLAAALLDPCVHLHLRDGRAEIDGVVRGTFRMRIEGVGCVVGVRFRPGGFHAFARQSVARWTDRTVPAEEALGPGDDGTAGWVRALWDAAGECRGDADAHAAILRAHLDAFLGARLRAPDPTAEQVADLVALVAASPSVRRVGDLARASGRSERTLHRLFVRYVGVGPAWVIRRYRLHAAARRLTACPDTDVGALAFELGYADQAHFIRDFRATIGVTPGAYVSAPR